VDIIVISVRLIIFITFLLLVAEGVTAIILFKRFYALYVRKHLELEKRVEVLEKRL
jgi:hypothetical protein